jgi:hypothetical protein
VRYSEFGKPFACERCGKITTGKLVEAKPPHFFAVYCEFCDKSPSKKGGIFLHKQEPWEPANPFVDHHEVFQLPSGKTTTQPSLFSE